jgi:tRNA uridine 5-carboxymethylaminomethyl modification enzyme
VVLTTGTFLSGLIHVGLQHYEAGRAGDPPAKTLGARLRELALPVGRLKTGTPPRLDGRTIDFSALEEQPGDDPAPVMSFLGQRAMHPRQVSCWITHTNERTHEIIRDGLDRSPLFTGVIKGVGPRYCPSIEDKVVRFAGRASHQIFLEPEGLATHEIYPNGISTSLPFDVQLALVRSIAGCADAHPLRRATRSDTITSIPARFAHLETKAIRGLFFTARSTARRVTGSCSAGLLA